MPTTDLHPDRVSEAYADRRILAKIAELEDPRARRGLRDVNEALKASGTPAATRLHLVTSVIALGHLAAESLGRRRRDAIAAR